MTKYITDNTYPFKHWFASLAVGPIFTCIQATVASNSNSIEGFVGMYFLCIIFGLLHSLPVFLVYLFLFNLLTKKSNSVIFIKTVLNLVAIIGAFVAIKLIGGTMMTTTLAMHYSVALFVCSFFYKLRTQKTTDTEASCT